MSSTPTASEIVETTCWYCSPEGEIEGTLLVVQKNHIVLFTPTDLVNSPFDQCMIHINDCFELGTVSYPIDDGTTQVAYYVQLQFKAEPVLDDLILRNVYLRFVTKADMVGVAKVLLRMKSEGLVDDYDESITKIPCYSDHMNLSPIVSPEIKRLSAIVSTGMLEPRQGERATPSPRPRSEEDPILLLSPPMLLLDVKDKPAIEFAGTLLASANSELIAEVRELLPLEYRFNEWRLIYSPKIHGISIPSFYRRFQTNPFPAVIVVTDAKRDCVFGAFCRSPWLPENQRKYFGSNDNFLFSIKKKGVVATKYYPWIPGTNTLFQYSDEKKLVVGGGATGSGLALFENWLRGVSNACETFGTMESLCCSHDFVVGDVEFWGILPEGFRGNVKVGNQK